MATSELAIRFTDEKYLTKNEVIKELKMNIVDSIWSNILSYRSGFNHYINLKSIERNQLCICKCALLENLVSTLEEKGNHFISNINFVKDSSEDRIFHANLLSKCLSAIARKHNIDMSSSMIGALINGENAQFNASHEIVTNYNKALCEAMTKPSDINYAFLQEIYSILSNDNSAQLFRTKEDLSHANKVIIDRVYTAAPSSDIPVMMEYLFNFCLNSTLDIYVIAGSAFYYINYVKPFSSFNEEMATIVCKAILSSELGGNAFYLPIEELFSDCSVMMNKVFTDTQKSTDLTYTLIFFINFLTEVFDVNCDMAIKLSSSSVKTDFYKIDDVKPVEEVKPVNGYTVNAEPKQEQIKVEEIKPVEAEPKPVTKVVQQKPKPTLKATKVDVTNEMAFSYTPVNYTEKELKHMANDLLENDPLLSKKEAKFYVSHCIIGKMYSIGQFQKEIGCVYETARTSMDHLATLGYYKKEQIKNKFFYTPISRK